MDILEILGLTWQSILFHAINLAIIVVAAYFLLRKPIRKMVKKQNETLQSVADENERLKKEAEEQTASLAALTTEAKAEAAKIRAEAEGKAREGAEAAMADAEQTAARIVAAAKTEAAAEKERVAADYAAATAALSVEIAGKILAREVKLSDNQKIVDDCIKELNA